MDHDLTPLNHWLDVAMSRLDAASIRAMQREIGKYLKTQTTQHIRQQTSPEGKKWQQRKDPKNRRAMMVKLKKARFLKIKHQAAGLRIGWSGSSGKIAHTHHFGLRQKLQWGVAKYPERPLLGITHADEIAIQNIIIKHLTGE